MQSSQNKPLPRAVDDRRRGSAHYYSEYEQIDQPTAQRSPTREVPISQPTQRQQRMMQIEPARQPVANNASLRRGAPNGMPAGPSPPYPGPGPHEELLSKTNEAIKQRQLEQQQQPRRRGYRRTDESGDDADVAATNLPFDSRDAPPPSQSAPHSNQSPPNTRTRVNPAPPQSGPEPQRGSPRKGESAQTAAGNSIPRLNSPTIMSSVLQPLDGKINEYGSQMNDAHAEMARLDAEMAALQERRREAEKRYMAAKTKHDDYRRQYQSVERAMRGEPDMAFSRLSMESERPSTQQTAQQPPTPGGMHSRTESWNSFNEPKRESGSRFRISKLFG
ncbi:uncharacterized protein LY89DRAFT_738540 [Mollisia scopiformis]|uniref:Uncharacterized protein n=1 Tax=Mollisia scopiformis TaxID=149040 RepID=A0A194WVA4_MOLSC|nr:uncharacterized protein LY89DRAFT_738540 [Mollisia scopiformis]KUJ11901.1 hypothetical protein LY89DRAFT_738540 [Mollisia scopiformis]